MHPLADDRGHPTQRGFIIILQRFAIEQNVAAVGAPCAGQQLQQGGLAAAGAAEQGDVFAGRDLERDVAQHRLRLVGVGETQLPQAVERDRRRPGRWPGR